MNKKTIRALNTLFGVSSLVLTGLLITPSLQAQPPVCDNIIDNYQRCDDDETPAVGPAYP